MRDRLLVLAALYSLRCIQYIRNKASATSPAPRASAASSSPPRATARARCAPRARARPPAPNMIYSMPLTMTLSMPLKSVLQCIYSLAALTVARASNTMCANLCRAPAGYEVAVSGSTILSCPANHFHNGTGMLCTRCPSPSTFSADIGLTSVSACHCSAGFHRVAGECTACEHGSYKAEIGDGFYKK